MKRLLLSLFSFISFLSFSQPDSIRTIEPGQETSFENYELLVIALLGLVLLIGVWFWFRRTRKNKG
ncbi:MAG TPA: LPXTG cell wall anchor domain-containing protein [Flavisolibacter sp.]|jgi:LPXTG-motif cell wall-anchored protein|nr:LPXTG cell wall anchor domain-containing protein [Flavisolibacter sp.]